MFVGDENCLFRAVSLACYGSEEYHDTLRQLAATEMLQHPQWYDAEHVDSRHPLRNEPDILLPQYEEACCEVSWSGQAVGVTAVLASSAVIDYPIHTFWPPLKWLSYPGTTVTAVYRFHTSSTRYVVNYGVRPKTWRGPH